MTPVPRRDLGAVAAWRPTFGAWPDGAGTRFRVWAPGRRAVEVVVEGGGRHALAAAGDGTFGGVVAGIAAGARYRYALDGDGPYPDPASRFQPDGVHGPSEVVDPHAYAWRDAAWAPPPLDRVVLYELHVGTFTPAGTFAGVVERLPFLRDLGVTAIELMPVAAFAGERNWGYDGVALWAPARCYGRPDDLRRLVDAAHAHGLAVVLDVVYNHLGPDGAYLATVSPPFFGDRHHTPWGKAVNLDGPERGLVRDLLVDNAVHWLREYRFDGLRLDATHALVDESRPHFLAELSSRVRAAVPERPVLLIAEDARNLAKLVVSAEDGGFGLDAVWADDLHHELRVALAGDRHGYYQDFTGATADVVTTLRQGWFYCGQPSAHEGRARGSDPAGIPPHRFVVCLQNHDQIGNRAFGDRLHHQIDLAAWRAAVTLLLFAPETPLLFMGQEWAASTPFLYFTDHEPALGRKVTAGRRREFAAFPEFADEAIRARIPDPQAVDTFRASRLDWAEAARMPHAGVLALHRALLRLRRTEALLARPAWDGVDATALDADTLLVAHADAAGTRLVAVVRLRGAGPVTLEPLAWAHVLDTEQPEFAADPRPIALHGPTVRFARPGAVVLRA